MKYFEKIDGLRFIAILAVMVHHIASIFSTYIDWGYFGVDLFFVISGFLITTILLKSKGNFKTLYYKFLARRSLRIFPLYYFVLILLILLGNEIVKDNIIYLATYTFNYQYPFIDTPNPVGHFWSLSVEEQFYFFWPFIVIGLRYKEKTLMAVVLLMISFGYLQIYFSIIPSLSSYNYTGLPARMGSLGLGALGSIMFMSRKAWLIDILTNRYLEYVMYFILMVSLLFMQPILMGLSSLFMVLKAANNSYHARWVSKLLTNQKVLYIGRISYGLYIYHVPVIFYVTPYVFDPVWNLINFEDLGALQVLKYHSWIIKFPLYCAITIVIAELSYRYFEKPLLGLKDRFFKYAQSAS